MEIGGRERMETTETVRNNRKGQTGRDREIYTDRLIDKKAERAIPHSLLKTYYIVSIQCKRT